MKPMLAREIDIDALDTYLQNDLWVAQQKLDGDRILIDVNDGQVRALNRHGEPYRNPFPRKVLREFSRMPGRWVFDGEFLDDGYWIFDLPRAQHFVTPERDLAFRLAVLDRFFAGWAPDGCVRLLPTARTTEAKCSLAEQVTDSGGEGLMFRQADAPYLPGKRSYSMLKAKFTKTADVVITQVSPDGRANAFFGLFNNGELVEIGSYATAGKPAVQVGDVVELRYLYAGKDHRLVQPRMLRKRPDKSPTECTIDQLQFTNREVVMPDDRPLVPTSASFVSRVLREAGIPKASAYNPCGREQDGFVVAREPRISVASTLHHEQGLAQVEQIRKALAERDIVTMRATGWGAGGVYVLDVKGRR